ncbi:MAG TPA: MFS transporter [Candidatus Scatomonas merdavium]|nr:MFS transporter [Candidatus Scatomonas merdavium]
MSNENGTNSATAETSGANVYKLINWKVMIPVMLFVMFQSAFNSFSSVLADIAQVFPDAPTTLVQMILTIPSLISIPMGLLAGVLGSYIYKKHLVLFSLLMELIGGVLPLFIHDSIYSLVISSALIGVGQGLLINVASAVVGENFTGTTSGVAMGLKQAASSIGIAILTVATGFLARSAWFNAYYVYLAIIPIFILTWIFLPKGKKDVKLVGKGVGISGLKKVFTRGCIYYSILSFFLAAANFAFYTNVGLSIVSKGLGDAGDIGIATAWNSVITIILGLIFGYVLKLFKRFTMAAAVIIQAASYLILANATSLGMVSVGGMIYGLGAGMQMVAACYYILESVEQDAASMAIAVCMFFTSIGVSLSPVVINAIAPIFGPELNGVTGFMAAASLQIVIFVIEIAYCLVFNRNSRIGK